MTAKPSLRAVKSDESAAPPPPKPKTVAQAAATGDPKVLLIAMRDRIARTVSDPDCPPRDLAALTRRLQDIAKELDALELRAKQEASENVGSASEETWDESAI